MLKIKEAKTIKDKLTLTFFVIVCSPTVHLSRINGTSQQLKPLYLQPSKSSFCIFSLAFSNCGDQIIGGGSDGCLYIYDLVMAKRTFRCPVSRSVYSFLFTHKYATCFRFLFSTFFFSHFILMTSLNRMFWT